MAVTHTLLTEGSDETNGTSFTTASITPSSNKLLLIDIAGEATTAAGNVQPTVSGCGVTWVPVVSEIPTHGDFSRLTTFRAMGTPTTGVLTITFSSTQEAIIWSVCEKGNVDTGGTNGSAAVVQSASNANASTSLTVTLAAFGNVNNATHGAFQATIEASGLTVTPGTGFTEETEITADLTGGWFATLQTQYRDDNDTTVDVTISATPDTLIGTALEIKEAVGDTNISAGTDALILTEYAANVNAETNIGAGIGTLSITTYSATVSLGIDIQAALAALTITEYVAEVSLNIGVNAGFDTLVITSYPATISTTVDINIDAGVASLTITAFDASITLDRDVNVGVVALLLSAHKATITSGVSSTTYTLLLEKQMIAQLTDTLFPLDIAVDDSGGVAGLAITVALRDPNNSSSYLDFNDGTFKTSGWTTQYQSLTDYGSGFYGTNLDVSAITNFPSANHAGIEFSVTGTVVAISQGVLSISQTWQQAAALTVGKFLGLI